MNILVTGANGQLGQCLRDLVDNGCEINQNTWVWTDVSSIEGLECQYLDITDAEAVKKFFIDNSISVCINCAAYTNVDRAETDQELARKLNAIAPQNLAEACNIHGAKLIHISTDYVFNGLSFIPITEDRGTFPTSVYGRTKLEGEQNIINSGCKYMIFRTAWLYSEYGNNFVKTMVKLIESRPEISVVYDQIGTPTYARNLAELIYTCVQTIDLLRIDGIFHYTDDGVCSWYDFAHEIMEALLDIETGKLAKIIPVTTEDFYGDKPHAPRPYYSVLSKEKVKNTFSYHCKRNHWSEGVWTCVSNLIAQRES